MKPYILCEPFAGSAGLTYRMLGGKPPISYVGSKTGYAQTIAACIGLTERPAGIVLGEPGPFAAVHACLGGAAGMSAEDVAGWVLTGAWSFEQGNPVKGYNKRMGEGGEIKSGDRVDFMRAATPDKIAARVEEVARGNARDVAAIIRSWKDEEPRALWERLKAKGWPSLLLPEGCGGRWLGPQSVEEVAGFLAVLKRSFYGEEFYKKPEVAGEKTTGGKLAYKPEDPAPAVETIPTFPPLAVWQGTAETLPLPNDLTGFVLAVDPPYKGDGTRKITGYPHGDCTRETVLRLARGWSERGAVVAISECVSLRAELGEGWHDVDISHARKGQKRTFGNTAEWLTLNREPAYRPHRGQVGLFGGGR